MASYALLAHSLTHELFSPAVTAIRRRRWQWNSTRRRRRNCRRESLSSTTSPLPYGRTFGATTCTMASTTRIPPFRFRIIALLRSEWSKSRFVLLRFLVFFVFHYSSSFNFTVFIQTLLDFEIEFSKHCWNSKRIHIYIQRMPWFGLIQKPSFHHEICLTMPYS